MKLVPNWRAVLKRAWSAWLSYASSALGIAVYYVPSLQDYVSPETFLLILALAFAAQPLLRIIKQEKVSDDQG